MQQLSHVSNPKLAGQEPHSPHVDVGCTCAHGCACNQAALHQLVGVMAHDLPVLAGAWLGLICIHHHIRGPAIRRLQVQPVSRRSSPHLQQVSLSEACLGHEAPLEARGEAGAATASEARSLDLAQDPVCALDDQVLGAIPVASAHGTLHAPSGISTCTCSFMHKPWQDSVP